MKRILFILIIALILLGLLFYSTQSKEHTFQNTIKSSSTKTKIAKEVQAKKPEVEKVKTKKELQEVKESREAKSIEMYETLSLEEASLTTKARHAIAPVSAIVMKKHTLQAKDILILPNIEGFDYSIEISHVMTHANGSTSTTGAYIDEGIRYTTTITQSDTQSFISLATAQGLYEIETSNGVGYIYRTDAIRQYLQSEPLNDTIILPLSK